MEFTSIEQLEAYLQRQIQETLKDDVEKEVKKVMKHAIATNVYAKYTPRGYQRRFDSSRKGAFGLLAEQNMKGEYHMEGNHMILSVRNKARGDERADQLDQVIESGEGYDWFHSSGKRLFPRPFYQPTRDMLARTRGHVTAMKNGLRKRGIEVY
ncbi:hypothetical protein [Bacillus thuringiensis]|uniref:hypothetical protein n=1 Tax=Bacillus thuringiensis TaxID=1428 RepID=UPI000BF54F7B|nr:hypothetical protein [Bacillus thuringiensis]MDO6628707.1 hypothetical protein [Bacillus thuringiensis]MDO6659168.1 hypothetical protein [Bacillus thuringiensis]MDO6698750.1 hypothetical protein [Bacillus thuringiensis]PES54504.1 hypothetical protein CN506_20750 [Bacillus thuringiensis]